MKSLFSLNSIRYLTGLLLICTFSIQAQVTTSSISGLVSDEKGEVLPGATIVAIHIPSGSKYGTLTSSSGRFHFPNVRVGGPYLIQATFVGYKISKIEGVVLSLGQKFIQDFKLVSENSQLEEVTVKADALMNNQRTGAATNISSEQLRALPTITRSASDFTRLTPMAGDNNSFGGRNGQFNNFSLDGAIFNNPFGLDAATPGGQTDAQPVSLDAIDQIQVSIAPYDVTQAGFTGASVNAVTKSGTNKFTGVAFGYFRNQSMTGSSVAGSKIFVPDLSQGQYGFSVGGPIIKDKLFFFANMEIERRSDLGSGFLAASTDRSGSNISRVQAADLQLVSKTLFDKFGYQTGPYENFTHKTDNTKAIFKLDWNISDKHKLTATYSFLDASKDKPANPSALGRRGPDFLTLQFYNSGYRINNKLNSLFLELKSAFSNKYSNKLQAGYSTFNDTRDPFSTPFPIVNIDKDGTRYIVAGHEPFSIHNKLDQYVFQINDNFNIYAGNNTITLGGSLEKFSFDNSFNLGAYAGTFGPDYPSVQDFVTAVNSGALDKDVQAAINTFKDNNAKNTWALAQTEVGQLAFYGQDEIQLSPKFTVTIGLRMDKPLYFNTKEKIEENIKRNCCYDPSVQYYDEGGNPVKFDHTVLPKATPLFSPRIGFNYDIKGDRSEQIRGGSGLFTGRFPFVWIGNQVANPNSYFYCVTDPNFKFPQVWRSNLGYDKKLANGWILTTDLIYTKDINAMMVRNYGLKLPTGKLTGADTRPVYKADEHPTNAYVFTNTDLGYSWNWTIQAQKTWKNGVYVNIGYNYLNAQDAASIQAEISSDAYDRNPANPLHTNTPILAPSVFGNQHRFVGSASRKFVYSNWATTISLFAQYVKGGRYSYTYSGDLNNDGSGLNDLMFIPTDAQIDAMKFSVNQYDPTPAATQIANQKAGLKAYIAQDEYLSGHRGQIAEKYGNTSPWYSNWDLSILQDYILPNKNKIQISLNILNIGNLINSKWGVRQVASITSLVQPLGVTVDGSGVPTYSFDTAQKSTFYYDNGLVSRWQAQLGLRYIF
ncbi:Carboxypeptidase regulatory-like domain-containing protein [Pseudarcicella hirudinis]|uniref:Carboxypeptidase regulatory-like domain-containing protein n=1 Tax=Pseudarcicella hirudinis TaxID=1079859 RepID=A0A1I5M253_9BACT|nr:TonB-dependent receptor [Pseudarcicella hirudinis]SFP03609.1 Carboxypeptidase regulatory-like domain-containing protein [Pseudarcicella hirudinis]